MYFKPRSKMVRTLLRSVTSQHIGCLVKLRVSRELMMTRVAVGRELIRVAIGPSITGPALS